LEFKVLHKCRRNRARVAQIGTGHGTFETPVFMPVGTQGSVKSLSPEELEDIGVRIILANTYHLYLRPGHRVIEKLGGLHCFMGWNGPILTDSGGYQVFSLSQLRTVSDEGVIFQSHLDGSRHFIGPREAIAIQEALGADIIMTLDECAPYPAERDYVKESVRRTSLWARICLESKTRKEQSLFGIVQGGTYQDLREQSALDLVDMGFEGYALGGLSVGEDKETRNRVIRETIPLLPGEKPVYLMGVGMPEDIIDAVILGVDMFDCVLPTRNARNGTLFTAKGRITIKNARYVDDGRPLEEGCGCYTCSRFSRAYLRHLFMARELLSYRLNTIHNIYFYIRLMESIRSAIRRDKLEEFRSEFLDSQKTGSEHSFDENQEH